MSTVTKNRAPTASPKTDADRQVSHVRPDLIVLAFLVPMVLLTLHYYD